MMEHGGSNPPNHPYKCTELIAVMSTERCSVLNFCIVLWTNVLSLRIVRRACGSLTRLWFISHIFRIPLHFSLLSVKVKVIPQQAEVALGVPSRLRPRIFSTFDTTRVLGRQPNAPAAFTLGEIPGTHFQRLSRPQGTWLCRKEPRKKSQVTPPGIDPGTVRPVAQRLNHYATPDPDCRMLPSICNSGTNKCTVTY
jgi:hypothetical protein